MKFDEQQVQFMVNVFGEDDAKYIMEFMSDFTIDEYMNEMSHNEKIGFILDEYEHQYLNSIYHLWTHNPIDDVIVPLLSNISTYIELVLKQLILNVDEMTYSINKLEIGHHNLQKLINHECIVDWTVGSRITNDQYNDLKKCVLYFHSLRENSPNLSMASRYPIEKKNNDIVISGEYWSHKKIEEIHQHWMELGKVLLSIQEREMALSMREAMILHKKYEKMFKK